jgi:hypothetical protein
MKGEADIQETSYFTPIQEPPSGAARDPSSASSLFQPISIGKMSIQNRIMVRHPTGAATGPLTHLHLGIANVPVRHVYL